MLGASGAQWRDLPKGTLENLRVFDRLPGQPCPVARSIALDAKNTGLRSSAHRRPSHDANCSRLGGFWRGFGSDAVP